MFADNLLATTASNTTTADGPNIATLKSMMANFREKFPPSDMVNAYRMNGEMINALKSRADCAPPSSLSLSALVWGGIPVHRDESLVSGTFVSERADGTEVVHFNGFEWRRPNLRKNPELRQLKA